MATLKTNISDNNNSSSRLKTTQGGLGNTGTIGPPSILVAGGTNSCSFLGMSQNGNLLGRSTSTTLGTYSTFSPIFSGTSSTAITAAVCQGYVTSAGTLATLTLPTTFAVGQQIGVVGQGAGGWLLRAGTATTIQYGASATTSAGSLASTNRYDNCIIIGIVANTTWAVLSSTSSGLTVA